MQGAADPFSRILLISSFFVIYVAWGISFLFIGKGVQSIGPLYFAALRWTLAGLLLLVFTGGWRRPPSPGRMPQILMAGLLLYVLGNGGMSLAMRWVPSGIAALIVATTPIWLIAIHWVLARKSRYGWQIWLGIFCGTLGVALLVFDGPTRDGETASRWPFAILLFAAACWTAGTVYVTRHGKAAGIFHDEIGFQMLAGGIILFAASALKGEAFVMLSPSTWLSLSYLVLIGSILGMASYQYLLSNVSTLTVSTYAFVNPLVALLAGAVFSDEKITVPVLISAMLIVSSVALLLKPNQPAGKAETGV